MRQVRENVESTQRQYGLKHRALALGWPVEQVVVIDCDQGQSGSSAVEREGFQKLVAEVSMNRAGIVMGLEVSRLARNSSDWHRLLEICALTHTLLLDEEGLYDPSNFNDRLLLGLRYYERGGTAPDPLAVARWNFAESTARRTRRTVADGIGLRSTWPGGIRSGSAGTRKLSSPIPNFSANRICARGDEGFQSGGLEVSSPGMGRKREEPTKVMQPSKQLLYSPTPSIAAQRATVLCRLRAFPFMRCKHLDSITGGQVTIQAVAVIAFIANQPSREAVEETMTENSFPPVGIRVAKRFPH
jgi:hypothetical protein